MQVKLANELQKPLFLHCRDAAERFTAILQEQGLSVPAVAHCFTGSREDLKQYCQMGLHIGITGWVSTTTLIPTTLRHAAVGVGIEPLFQTYALIVRSDGDGSGKASTIICVQVCDDRPDRGGAELAQLLQLIPPDKLMIETDGPYLVPRTIKPAKARPRRCAKLTDLGYSYCWQFDSEAELRPVLIVRQPTVRPHKVAVPVDTSWLDTSDASVSICAGTSQHCCLMC